MVSTTEGERKNRAVQEAVENHQSHYRKDKSARKERKRQNMRLLDLHLLIYKCKKEGLNEDL